AEGVPEAVRAAQAPDVGADGEAGEAVPASPIGAELVPLAGERRALKPGPFAFAGGRAPRHGAGREPLPARGGLAARRCAVARARARARRDGRRAGALAPLV